MAKHREVETFHKHNELNSYATKSIESVSNLFVLQTDKCAGGEMQSINCDCPVPLLIHKQNRQPRRYASAALMLYLVGLGLADEKDITIRGLECVKSCAHVYLESYTSILLTSKESLVRPSIQFLPILEILLDHAVCLQLLVFETTY